MRQLTERKMSNRQPRIPIGGGSDAIRRTDNLQELTTRRLRLLNENGTAPELHGIPYIGDTVGDVKVSAATLTADGSLVVPGTLTATGNITLTSAPPQSAGGNQVLSYDASTGAIELQTEGASSAVLSVLPASGNIVIDPPAGVGNVTVDLSSNITVTGRITAADLSSGTLHLSALTTGTNTQFLSINAGGTVQKQSGVTSVTAGTGLSNSGTATNPVLNLTAVGTANTYAYPASLTTDSTGRITVATAGTAPITSVSAGTGIAVTAGTTPTVSNTGLLGLTAVNQGANITITGTSTAPIISAAGGGGGTVTTVNGGTGIQVNNNTTTPGVSLNFAPDTSGQLMYYFNNTGTVISGPINFIPTYTGWHVFQTVLMTGSASPVVFPVGSSIMFWLQNTVVSVEDSFITYTSAAASPLAGSGILRDTRCVMVYLTTGVTYIPYTQWYSPGPSIDLIFNGGGATVYMMPLFNP